ncbi:RNA polymerase sigma factor [Sphingobacterium faecium]|uniref:RNA polymerase sigma factor n=1 Tax=Sphingobacterium faecium TaxID=34087 RepID=UPI00097EB0DA|nr:sigma-70 family RNA polymerase sigma factor [Sphingobacterium faecium]UXD68439.1 sigma-70 family RNA polymerase sigma factor [Sphingobacterium faecium]WGQ16144.1 sigma-70 family RNA polymerase sigma factor [Sphingobacterium faecium]SJN49800.1 RNA polymerase ECF-type sigma factor [Sphingobacterium faecium PCAi_F2.5]HCU46225.1 sigma-70 family RNA polymerase sigma factor [Sphingobacterium sp.]
MNQETFKTTVFIHKDRLFRFANRFLLDQDDAFDLVQEVLLKLWEARTELLKVANIEAYVMRMTKNLALNRLNREGVKTKYMAQLDQDIQKESYPSLTRELILKLIDRLPEKQRLVMYLRDIEEYEIADIVNLVGIDENAVRVNLSRARNVVKVNLTKVFDYEERRIKAIRS